MPSSTLSSIRAQVHHASHEHQASLRKVVTLEALSPRLAQGSRAVVFTKGVFDILHRGHLHLMAFCTQLKRSLPRGVLVVGTPTDRVVRARKGPDRPFNPQEDRLAQLAALESVDYVVLFDEPYPTRLIQTLHPAVYVKGEDTSGLSGQGQADGEVEVPLSDSNPELPALLAHGGRLVIFTDDGSISVGALAKRIRATAGRTA